MTGRCLACGEPIPDIPTSRPLTYCTARCRARVADAIGRFLDAVAVAPDDPAEDGTAP